MRIPEIKKMFSDEKDLSIKLRGSTDDSGNISKILEEARGYGQARPRQDGDTAPTRPGREPRISGHLGAGHSYR